MTTSSASLRTGLLWAARLLLVLIFAFSALDKAVHFDRAVAEMQGFGLPLPRLTAAGVVVVQAAGVILVLLPRGAPIGAALLAAFTLGATLLAHRFWDAGPDFTMQLTIFLEHMAIIGGLVLLGVSGASNKR